MPLLWLMAGELIKNFLRSLKSPDLLAGWLVPVLKGGTGLAMSIYLVSLTHMAQLGLKITEEGGKGGFGLGWVGATMAER